MASRFVRVEIVKAEGGSSATGLSAYIGRDARVDQNGTRFNFSHRANELVASGLILPKDAPEWAADAGRIWREAERAEQTVDRKTGETRWKKGGQVAKHMMIALPREASAAQREDLLLKFIATELDPQKHGVAVEWAIHHDDGNPHAHLLISTRLLAGEGFGKKARAMNPDFASKGDRHFISEAENWDVRWADFQKRYFAELGVEVDVRDRLALPEDHYTRGQLRDDQVVAERADIAAANAAAELVRLRDPDEILKRLTANRAIFTNRDMRQALNKSGLEDEQRSALEAAITGHADIRVLVNEIGVEVGWTTQTVRDEETEIVAAAGRMSQTQTRTLGRAGYSVLSAAKLSGEQLVAAHGVVQGGQINFVVGRAGTGKSHTLNVVRRAYEADGFQVIGLAPTNAVVADLRKDGYRHAATLHRELWALDRDPSRWNRKTVVVVDEAAMVDNEMLAKLFRGAERSGAKLILAGDDRQFASVARGGMFGELVTRHRSFELTEVRRQRQDYQAKASEDFARGDLLAALKAYDDRGQIVWCDSLADARQKAVAAQSSVTGASFLYASTNKEVEELNRTEQQRRRGQGEAAGKKTEAHEFKTVRGDVSIAAGERVQFYETDRKLGIATSEYGTVKIVTPQHMEVVKDDGSIVSFDPQKYDQWGLGYSGTGYKGQGKTQPKTAAVYDNPYAWDARAAYVISTRHRDDYQLFVPRELAPDLSALVGQIVNKREDRGASIRFNIGEAQRPEADRELAAFVAAGRAAAKQGYAEYKQQKALEMARDNKARGFVIQWNGLVDDYNKALPRLLTGSSFGEAKERLTEFGHSLLNQPEVLAALRQRGPELGVTSTSVLAQVLASANPVKAIAEVVERNEENMRSQLQKQAEQEAKTQSRGMTL